MLWEALQRLDARAAVDILLIAVVIYYFLNLLRGTRAVQMLAALGAVALLYYGARRTGLEMVDWLLTTIVPYAAIALIVVFHPEIRQALARAGSNPLWRRLSSQNPAEAHDDVVLALAHCAQNRIGALVVLERDTGLRTYIESGVPLDAAISHDLLLSIFQPGSPLHDGAAILQRDRVAAAACFLPLSLNPALTTQLGTRHRAAIGVTEESDAIAIVVSEQTGAIALAAAGEIEMNLTPEQLAEKLAEKFARYRPTVALPAPAGGARPETARD